LLPISGSAVKIRVNSRHSRQSLLFIRVHLCPSVVKNWGQYFPVPISCLSWLKITCVGAGFRPVSVAAIAPPLSVSSNAEIAGTPPPARAAARLAATRKDRHRYSRRATLAAKEFCQSAFMCLKIRVNSRHSRQSLRRFLFRVFRVFRG